jgi:hypothetical protein
VLKWLLLVHQLPPRPLYLRAQVRRRLAQVGALPLKNSVYVLPDLGECREDLQWIAQEAVAGGGDASVCRAEFVEGLVDAELQTRFQQASEQRFGAVQTELQRKLSELRRGKPAASGGATIERLQRTLEAAAETDFFNSEAGAKARQLMAEIRNMLRPSKNEASTSAVSRKDLQRRVWVTRRDPHIDRLATAWLIRRFVDPAARFRFVDPSASTVKRGERSFDMTGADFTHDGDRCSFETMCDRLGLKDDALRQLAEIVHDLDLKDSKFGRADAVGVQRLVEGLSAAHADSAARVTAALPIFDVLFAAFGGHLARAGRARR